MNIMHFQEQLMAVSVATLLTKQYEVYSTKVDANVAGAGICYGVHKGSATTYVVFTYNQENDKHAKYILNGVSIVDYVNGKPHIVASHQINDDYSDMTTKVANITKWCLQNI